MLEAQIIWSPNFFGFCLEDVSLIQPAANICIVILLLVFVVFTGTIVHPGSNRGFSYVSTLAAFFFLQSSIIFVLHIFLIVFDYILGKLLCLLFIKRITFESLGPRVELM